MKNGLEEQEEQQEQQQEQQEEQEGDLDDEVDASHLRFMRDRRRARSLPALLGPGSGGRKRVKFADSMGLDLASVKHFSSLEDPQVPSTVLSRHQSLAPRQHDLLSFRSSAHADRLVACFAEPRDAQRRVARLRVCLEKVSISQFDVRGHIRVLARCAQKEVGLRYTFNDWLSYVDAQAVPAAAPDAAGERFSFTVYTPPVTGPRAAAAVHFAVYVRSEEGEFWDNCEGRNYTLRYRTL
ncbi:Protein phosphatase 1 regulatory subunit 3G [Liparis tanakae]|uniref:Protein phosphatase 1 regulatory subunit 3G n=1 Tax=Liparis tanakae TaxID=230148 RepID=A0A4Z2E6M3_9TELE|nr:Protein phosphatase 1 regulatory subunit 3G [Liparis tanakae]